MRRRPVLASTVLAAALLLAGCGSSEPESSLPTASGEFGEKPEITFPDAEPPAELTTDVISEGDGPDPGRTSARPRTGTGGRQR